MAQKQFGSRKIFTPGEKARRRDIVVEEGELAARELLRRETPVDKKNLELGVFSEEETEYEQQKTNERKKPLTGITSPDDVDKAILERGDLSPLVDNLKKSGGILTGTKAIDTFSKDEGAIQTALDEEISFQREGAPKTGTRILDVTNQEGEVELDAEGNPVQQAFNVLDTEKKEEGDIDSIDKFQLNLQRLRDDKTLQSSRDALTNFISSGESNRNMVQDMISPLLQDQSELGKKTVTVMRNNGILDSNDRVTTAAANAIQVAYLRALKSLKDKEDTRVTKAERQLAEEDITSEKLEEIAVTSKSLAFDKVDPNDVINGLADRVLDSLSLNPAEVADGVTIGFGGQSRNISEDVKSVLSTILYSGMAKQDIISKIPDEEMIVISPFGEVIYENQREILDDLDIRDITFRAKVPYLFPGQERLEGLKKKGQISKSNKSDSDVTTEQFVKNILGSVPLTIVPERFQMAKLLVESVIESDDGINVKGFYQEGEGGRRWSKAPAARTLGLNEGKWQSAFQEARKTSSDYEANRQANLVMIREAKKILKVMRYAAQEVGGVYYNKQFHATSVGRFFVRNTDINPQTSKLARMLVGNANTILLNPNKDSNTTVYENWAYIIGKNLMPLTVNSRGGSLTNNVRTEDMGWNAIQKPALEIINNPNNLIYKEWVRLGKLINDKGLEAIQSGQGLGAFKSAIGDELYNKIFDSEDSGNAGEWGYPLQSYLDMYEFEKARKLGTSFKPKAQAQHDGKQNGIAIQAMQYGRENILQRTGVLYANEDNVIPFGDIRDRFLSRMSTAVAIAFEHDKPRQAYWMKFVTEINNSKDYKNLGKALSKTPLMETSYGKFEGFNEETALAFIDKYGNEYLKGKPDIAGEYTRDDMIGDLNSVITETLREMLNLKEQQIVKVAGEMWAMLGVDASLRGPLGNTIYMGSFERQAVLDKSGQAITVPINFAEGVVDMPLTRMVSTASGRARKRKLIRDPKEKYGWRLEEQTKYGQEVGNQLPVLTIQQIDAAVMAETIYEVNKDRYDISKPPKFVIPVHDAIITDASSVNDYHSTINRQFRQVNNRYSVPKAIRQGLEAAKKKAFTELGENPNKEIRLDYESKYRALHDALVRLKLKEQKNAKLRIPKEETGIGGKRKGANLNQKDPNLILSLANNVKWKEDGSGFVKQGDIRKLLELFFKGNGILFRLKAQEDMAYTDRGKIYNDILQSIIYQYN